MGSQLVGRAFAFAIEHPLKPTEFRLLAFMAQTALDTDAEPRYFGSREMSAYGLGYLLPKPPAPDVSDRRAIELERESAFELVRRATKGLREAGAIRQLKRGRTGQRAEFTLTLNAVKFAAPVAAESAPFSPNKSLGLDQPPTKSAPTDRWGSDPTDRWATSPNKSLGSAPTNRWAQGTTEEPLQELLEEPRPKSASTTPTDSAAEVIDAELITPEPTEQDDQPEIDPDLTELFPAPKVAKKKQPKTVAVQTPSRAGKAGYCREPGHSEYPVSPKSPCDRCSREASEAA